MTVFRNLILLKANATNKLEKNMSNKKIYYLLKTGILQKLQKIILENKTKTIRPINTSSRKVLLMVTMITSL